MKLSTKTKYGTRALVELALAEQSEAVSTREVAEKQGISFKYLEQIMASLRAAGLVNSQRGQHGGYSLARRPENIKLVEIYEVLEGSTAPVECVDNPGSCPLEGVCAPRDTWAEMGHSIRQVLENTTLRDLTDRYKRKNKENPPMYQI